MCNRAWNINQDLIAFNFQHNYNHMQGHVIHYFIRSLNILGFANEGMFINLAVSLRTTRFNIRKFYMALA
jgi:hypothetical protein